MHQQTIACTDPAGRRANAVAVVVEKWAGQIAINDCRYNSVSVQVQGDGIVALDTIIVAPDRIAQFTELVLQRPVHFVPQHAPQVATEDGGEPDGDGHRKADGEAEGSQQSHRAIAEGLCQQQAGAGLAEAVPVLVQRCLADLVRVERRPQILSEGSASSTVAEGAKITQCLGLHVPQKAVELILGLDALGYQAVSHGVVVIGQILVGLGEAEVWIVGVALRVEICIVRVGPDSALQSCDLGVERRPALRNGQVIAVLVCIVESTDEIVQVSCEITRILLNFFKRNDGSCHGSHSLLNQAREKG
ncbi:hypothetical protein D3C73_918980 [compost metagenome]